jgi:hypothetical protein
MTKFSNLPSPKSYEQAYNLAFELIVKSPQEALNAIKSIYEQNLPVREEDVFYANTLVALALRPIFREIEIGKKISERIIIVKSNDFQANSNLFLIALSENDMEKAKKYAQNLLNANYEEFLENMKPLGKSNIPDVRNYLENTASLYQHVSSFFMAFSNEDLSARANHIVDKILSYKNKTQRDPADDFYKKHLHKYKKLSAENRGLPIVERYKKTSGWLRWWFLFPVSMVVCFAVGLDVWHVVIIVGGLAGAFFFWCVWGFMKYKRQEKRDKKEIGSYLLQGITFEHAVQKAFNGVNDKFELNLDPGTINAVAQKIAGLTNIMTEDNAIEIYSSFVNYYIFNFGRVKTPGGVSDQQVLHAVSNLNLIERNGDYVIGRDSWEDLDKKLPDRGHGQRPSIIERYKKLPEWSRWILLLPLSMTFSFLVTLLMVLIHLEPSRILGMISFLFAIHALAPRFKNYLVVGSIVLRMIVSIIIFFLIFIGDRITDPAIILEMCMEVITWAFSWFFYSWILRKTE